MRELTLPIDGTGQNHMDGSMNWSSQKVPMRYLQGIRVPFGGFHFCHSILRWARKAMCIGFFYPNISIVKVNSTGGGDAQKPIKPDFS